MGLVLPFGPLSLTSQRKLVMPAIQTASSLVVHEPVRPSSNDGAIGATTCTRRQNVSVNDAARRGVMAAPRCDKDLAAIGTTLYSWCRRPAMPGHSHYTSKRVTEPADCVARRRYTPTALVPYGCVRWFITLCSVVPATKLTGLRGCLTVLRQCAVRKR